MEIRQELISPVAVVEQERTARMHRALLAALVVPEPQHRQAQMVVDAMVVVHRLGHRAAVITGAAMGLPVLRDRAVRPRERLAPALTVVVAVRARHPELAEQEGSLELAAAALVGPLLLQDQEEPEKSF
jgi:hypothetical protein